MTLSPDADRLRALYQEWTDRMVANPEMDLATMRDLFETWHLPATEPEGVTYKEEVVAGVPAIWALPVDADLSKVLLYTHGGGFVVASAASHRKVAGHLAKALGVTAIVIDYRRAPEHPFPAQVEDSTAVYRALLERDFEAENITTVGDSAGGNLALSTVLKAREEGLPLPGHVICFSPWVDMEHLGETLATNEATDALVTKPLVQAMSAMFLGEQGSPTDPLANPLYADFSGFPPLYLNAGAIETLRDNAERLHERALAAGVDSTLSIVDDMQHVFTSLAGSAAEANEEIQRIAAWHKS